MTISNGLAMSWEEWHEHDAVALADLVRVRKVAPKELCAQAAEGVARIDPQIAAVLGLYDDVVTDPDKDGPSKEGRLYGVPMFLKDLGSGLAGRRQESGSMLFRDHVVEATDPLVENYLEAGLIPIGRSTIPEFGMTFDTATDYLGRLKVTRNPWRLERTPGGSSGGSAAAVAAGVLPLSMSSDGGGSTRIPASFCGLVGLKATRGACPGRCRRVNTRRGSASMALLPARFETPRLPMTISPASPMAAALSVWGPLRAPIFRRSSATRDGSRSDCRRGYGAVRR
jgi:amidase